MTSLLIGDSIAKLRFKSLIGASELEKNVDHKTKFLAFKRTFSYDSTTYIYKKTK